jgi:DNA-directed RNA polymerase specialized sigma24 family protein
LTGLKLLDIVNEQMEAGQSHAVDATVKNPVPPASRGSAELLAEAEPAIRSALRHKLFVSLDETDGRQRNMDALDLLGAVRLKLLQKLSQDPAPEGIENFSSYAATVTYHACSDYLRARYPQRTRLRNMLRRVIEKSSAHTARATASGELECGFSGWRGDRTAADASQVASLRLNPDEFLPSGTSRQSLDTIQPLALLSLIDSILEYLNAPVLLDDLVAIVGACLKVQDLPDESLPEPAAAERDAVMASREPGGYAAWLSVERMRLLWDAVKQLLPWHRAAFLLNLRDGDIAAFPYYGVASIEQIGQQLEFSDQQFAALSTELKFSPGQRAGLSVLSGSGQKFSAFWKFLPLDDNIIAIVLKVTRPQVISYRSKAVERLRRMLTGVV